MIVPRVVLDTNVVVSGLLGSDGPPARVLDLVREAQIRLLLDDRILDEYAVVLSRPKFRRAIDASDVELLLSLLSRFGERIAAPPLTVCLRDPDDGPFLEVAAAGGADALVTGNQKDYPPFTGLRIVGPADFLAGPATERDAS